MYVQEQIVTAETSRIVRRAKQLSFKARREVSIFEPRLDRDAAPPLYEQLFEVIARELLAGTIRPGTRLPSARNLAAHFSLSRETVRKAMDLLVRHQLIRTKNRRRPIASKPEFHSTQSSV